MILDFVARRRAIRKASAVGAFFCSFVLVFATKTCVILWATPGLLRVEVLPTLPEKD